MKSTVTTALDRFRTREMARVEILQCFLDSPALATLAAELNSARDKLQTDPSQIYTLLGDIIAKNTQLHALTLSWIEALTKIPPEDISEYIAAELFFKRESDNALASITFKVLQQASRY